MAQSRGRETRVQLLEAGADDVVAQPIDESELEAIVEALMLRAPEPARPADSTRHAGRAAAANARRRRGASIAFAAAKGGSGTTTLAVNTALVLAEMAPGSVAIADLDMYHGQVSTHLDIYARDSTAQIVARGPRIQAPDTIHESGKQHSSGLMVFGGPYRPDEGVDVIGAQLASLGRSVAHRLRDH